MVTLTVPCGGVNISIFGSLTLTILMTLSVSALMWHLVTKLITCLNCLIVLVKTAIAILQRTVIKIATRMLNLIAFSLMLVKNYLLTVVSKIKEYFMMNPFANMAIVCCSIAFLWRPGWFTPSHVGQPSYLTNYLFQEGRREVRILPSTLLSDY
jgi:hypothetical protein